MSGRRLAILALHKVGKDTWDAWGTWFYTLADDFAAQLLYLRDADWQVIDAQALLRGVTQPQTLPERAALITFDDGYKSVREVALPILAEFACPAIVFVPSDFVGRQTTSTPITVPRSGSATGTTWKSSSDAASPCSLTEHRTARSRNSRPTQERELARSKAALEARLGKPVEVIAYPYGDAGGPSAQREPVLRRTGYRAACLYGGGPNPLPVADPFSLTRVAIGSDTDLEAALAEGRPW